ncbi:MAG: uracil-DNA glycosylase [Myxococcota bacterium]
MTRSQDLKLRITELARMLRQQLEDLRACGHTFIPRPQAAFLPAGVCSQGQRQGVAGEGAQVPRLFLSSVHGGPQGLADGRDAINRVSTAGDDQNPRDDVSAALANAEQQLRALRQEEIGDCTRCKLCSGRTNIVFGVGNPRAEVVFVGEAPGADEDAQGEPFVGRAGRLLTRMIEAMGMQRQDVYICNVIKCRPPGNRDPEPDEVASCEPFLKKQLAIVQPRIIVALGRYACQCLLRTKQSMSRLRGQWADYEGIALMPTFHPAYLLRSPDKKREVWRDLRAVLDRLKS